MFPLCVSDLSLVSFYQRVSPAFLVYTFLFFQEELMKKKLRQLSKYSQLILYSKSSMLKAVRKKEKEKYIKENLVLTCSIAGFLCQD